MDKKKIKLIATDVDGTLVKDSSRDVPDEYIDIVQKLTDAGYLFVIASGRQYGSTRKMFERANRKLNYIADNGAHIVLNGENYSVTKMNREYVVQIMDDLRALYKDGCHVVASTKNGCYLESKDEDFIKLITDGYRNDVRLTDDILSEDEDIIKLAVYKKGSIRDLGESMLIPKWKDKVKTTMAGNEWVDFMDFSVDKGNALKTIQEAFGISKDETMVFGDNNNDLGLIKAATESYAVENAVDVLKEEAKYVCKHYKDLGVYEVLKQLVD